MNAVQAEVDKLTKYIESRFPVASHCDKPKYTGHKPSEWKYSSPTGLKYKELINFHSLKNPVIHRNLFSFYDSLESCAEGARAAFDRYAEKRNGSLHWRVKPEFSTHPKTGKWRFYMRLLISNKPVKENISGQVKCIREDARDREVYTVRDRAASRGFG